MAIAMNVLDSITIPSPCSVPWESMQGGGRTRFCTKCGENLHDVSELTRREAMILLNGGDKLPCLRIYRRADGRVMTADCLTKRERTHRWLRKRSAWAASLFAMFFLAGCGSQHARQTLGTGRNSLSESTMKPTDRRSDDHNHTIPDNSVKSTQR
ncbi:MAG TPA: hypothetical protein VGL71_09970 [Urbifossiella sp.]|jgi:hypothetical protein